MTLPFTVDQFLDVFRRYNEAVWPLQWVLNALAVVALVGALKGGRRGTAVAVGVLAALWMWVGLVYHLAFFRAINPAATIFGALFIAEGILIAWLGLGRRAIRFERHRDSPTLIGVGLAAYSLVFYPLLGYALGHRYPSAPTFGVPCPTTIFTFGLTLMAAAPRSRVLLLIPAAWSLLGLSAALQLGMWEDVGLVVAAIIAALFALMQRPTGHRGEVAFASP